MNILSHRIKKSLKRNAERKKQSLKAFLKFCLVNIDYGTMLYDDRENKVRVMMGKPPNKIRGIRSPEQLEKDTEGFLE